MIFKLAGYTLKKSILPETCMRKYEMFCLLSLGLMRSCLNQQCELQWHSSWLLHVVKTEAYSVESQSFHSEPVWEKLLLCRKYTVKCRTSHLCELLWWREWPLIYLKEVPQSGLNFIILSEFSLRVATCQKVRLKLGQTCLAETQVLPLCVGQWWCVYHGPSQVYH